jgi:hypothetical protein
MECKFIHADTGALEHMLIHLQDRTRAVFFHFLRISGIKEVRNRAPVSPETRLTWERKISPDPSLFRLQFDWVGGLKSPWNRMFLMKIFHFLHMEWERCRDDWNIDWYSDTHIRTLISNKFTALAKEWKSGQKRHDETVEECQERLDTETALAEKRARENARRLHVSEVIVHVVVV